MPDTTSIIAGKGLLDAFELDEPEDAGRYAFIRLDFRSLMIM